MLTGDHARFFEQPAAAAQPEAAQAGQTILQQLFGSHVQAVNQQVAQHAAALSGIGQQTLMRMLPVLASMIMGAMFQSATSGGGGGLFGQFLNAARGAGVGGLGGMFKQAFPQPPISQPATGQPSASQPGPGGVLGGLNSWFNTVAEPAAPPQSYGATPPSGNGAPPLHPMSIGPSSGASPAGVSSGGALAGRASHELTSAGPTSLGLDALRDMFQMGSAAQQKGLGDFQAMFETMTGAKPR